MGKPGDSTTNKLTRKRQLFILLTTLALEIQREFAKLLFDKRFAVSVFN